MMSKGKSLLQTAFKQAGLQNMKRHWTTWQQDIWEVICTDVYVYLPKMILSNNICIIASFSNVLFYLWLKIQYNQVPSHNEIFPVKLQK